MTGTTKLLLMLMNLPKDKYIDPYTVGPIEDLLPKSIPSLMGRWYTIGLLERIGQRRHHRTKKGGYKYRLKKKWNSLPDLNAERNRLDAVKREQDKRLGISRRRPPRNPKGHSNGNGAQIKPETVIEQVMIAIPLPEGRTEMLTVEQAQVVHAQLTYFFGR